ncbi:MAG: ABC transporter permease [Erysipelothrix sp.]|nr:ABC transporter permease [Erysipelothrix sp.]
MKILSKLTLKHLKLNRKRAIVTVVGIMLSTAMMLTIGMMFSSLSGSIKQDAIRKYGDYHTAFRMLEKGNMNKLINQDSVESYYASRLLGTQMVDDRFVTINEADDLRFDQFTITKGRLPENDKEIIVDQTYLNANPDVKLDDVVPLEFGNMHAIINDKRFELDYASFFVSDYNHYNLKETENWSEFVGHIDDVQTRDYKIVGVYDDFGSSNYGTRHFYTLNNNLNLDDAVVFIKFNDVNSVYEQSKDIVHKYVSSEIVEESYFAEKMTHYNESPIELTVYNTQLIVFYSGFSADNLNVFMAGMLIFILTILSIGSIIVIYNSFAISAIDRKREFGIYSSVGATAKQIKDSMYFEAVILGSIGIILGIVLAIGTSAFLINLIIHYTKDLMSLSDSNIIIGLHFDPILTIIPIFFMIVVIYLSVLLPARRSAKVSAITLIRQNDDIKLSRNKIKSNRLINKLFKAEGTLAHKNMQRNKKRYRITLLSLVMSVVMFVSFSMFSTLFDQVEQYNYTTDYNLYVSLYGEEEDMNKDYELITPFIKDSDHVLFSTYYASVKNMDKIISDDLSKYLLEDLQYGSLKDFSASFVVINDQDYATLQADLGAEGYDKIVKSRNSMINLNTNKVQALQFDIFNKERETLTFEYYDYIMDVDDSMSEVKYDLTIDNIFYTPEVSINNIKFSNQNDASVNVFLSESAFKKMLIDNGIKPDKTESYSSFVKYNMQLHANVKDPALTLEEFDNLNLENSYAHSPTLDLAIINNLITLVRIIVYLFITITTLIGITSVFNTIYTSITLRRREFAMLRSVGMDSSGFNRILVYESIILSIKTILYSSPFIGFSIFIFNWITRGVLSDGIFLIPWPAIFVSLATIFFILISIALYSSRSIKTENILESLRRELN